MKKAHIETDEGEIVLELFDDDAPDTVENFVGLAKGTKEWKDPKTGEMKKAPYYDGLAFHRVIDNFMIQGGDPFSRYDDQRERWGTGGPGFTIKCETSGKKQKHERGSLSMAKTGSKPASTKPRVIPPQPANRSTTLGARLASVRFGTRHILPPGCDRVGDGGRGTIRVVVLPDLDVQPTGLGEPPTRVRVAADVPADLLLPELTVRGGNRLVFTATVPEAPMDEDDLGAPWEHEVRFPGKVALVQPITIPQRVD